MSNRIFWRSMFVMWIITAIYFGLDSFGTGSWLGLAIASFGFMVAEDTDD